MTTPSAVRTTLTSYSDDQRRKAIAALLRGSVFVAGNAAALVAELAASGATIADDPSTADVVVVRAPEGEATTQLSDTEAGVLVAAAKAGTSLVFDAAAGDPLLRRLAEIHTEPTGLVHQWIADSALLAHGAWDGATVQARVEGAGAEACTFAHRTVLFAGAELVERLPEAAASLQPTIALYDPNRAERLQQQLRELELTNRRLAEGRLGVHDAAAARAAAATTEAGALRAQVHELEGRLQHALESARVNDELFQGARLELFEKNLALTSLERYVARQEFHPKLATKRIFGNFRNRLRRS